MEKVRRKGITRTRIQSYSLRCMTFCGCSTWKWHEKTQNVKEVAYYWINAQMSEKHGINYNKRDYYKSKCKILRSKLWWNKAWNKKKYPDFFESQFIINNALVWLFVIQNNVSSFSHQGSKTFCLLSAHLVTPENTTNNIVSITMFPSLARP